MFVKGNICTKYFLYWHFGFLHFEVPRAQVLFLHCNPYCIFFGKYLYMNRLMKTLRSTPLRRDPYKNAKSLNICQFCFMKVQNWQMSYQPHYFGQERATSMMVIKCAINKGQSSALTKSLVRLKQEHLQNR